MCSEGSPTCHCVRKAQFAMTSPKTEHLLDLRDPLRAAMLLSRLPVPGADGTRAAESAWSWPVVGAALGALAGAVAWTALAIGLPPAAAAGLALGVGMITTGGLHEDGLADCADGYWGGTQPARRLEIMKDSRIGAFGVLALILVIGTTWTTLAHLLSAGHIWPALIVPAVLSRGTMACTMAALPFARGDGLARHVGRPPVFTAGLASVVAILCAILICGIAGVWATVSATATGLIVAKLSLAKIGGQTGDVLGATQQLSGLAATLALAATLPA